VSRLAPQPGELVNRAEPVDFTFDGKPVAAFAGDTIGSALYAAGRRTFSRSFKYHRRRGLLCCAGHCPNCLVAVDGAPGVRACTEQVREGMRVEHMNASPGLERDAMAITDAIGGPFTPPGFYYKTFIRPRRLWPAYEWVLRHAAGLGRLPDKQAARTWRTEYRRRHADVLVVGGGRAGLGAAIAAAEQGADVVLVDDGPEPGGRMLWEGARERARALAARARELGVEVLAPASALGHYDGLVAVWQGDTLHQVRAREHVYATGTIEQPPVFAGNDLPGVMLSGAARRLVSMYAVQPGRRAVVATACDRGLEAALALAQAGVEVLAVADLRTAGSRLAAHPDAPAGGSVLAARLRERGVEVLSGWTIVACRGRRAVASAVLAPPAPADDAGTRVIACDLVVVSNGEVPATALISQAGGRTEYDPERGCLRIAELPPGVRAVGDLAGEDEERGAARSGATTAATTAATTTTTTTTITTTTTTAAATATATVAAKPKGKAFVCLCEDVTAEDIALGVFQGYDSIELCKRFTTVTMGPCQGRMCQLASVRQIAAETGTAMERVGSTTARPPWCSVPLGALAGRPIAPAKRSPIHGRHRELGAHVKWAGDWRRAYDYGDPEGEALNVHRAAGLIDVSTLGKLLVRGPQAGDLLDRLYPNRLSNLEPGRVRYGVLASDAGRIMDDGTITRIDEETFYVTTTSSGAGAVEQWFSWWLAEWGLEAHLSDVAQALCAVNLAGPRAREVLARLTDLDCSNAAFSYLDAREGAVAGVNALLMRIGFVGELGYEIHFPAAYGEDVWEAILRAGEPEGIRPFGLEPQRILRLQKQHIIVGQDTDSESTPFGAGMAWAVKLDKEEQFIGRWALAHAARAPAASSPQRETALVGFRVANGHVPTEGAVVLDDRGRAAGQVTSARRSRQLERVIGMAWVPRELAEDGGRITIADDGERIEAAVVTEPFYDPAGELLRS